MPNTEFLCGWHKFGKDTYATRRDADNALADFLDEAREKLDYDKEDFRIATINEHSGEFTFNMSGHTQLVGLSVEQTCDDVDARFQVTPESFPCTCGGASIYKETSVTPNGDGEDFLVHECDDCGWLSHTTCNDVDVPNTTTQN